ncbi:MULTISPECIES: S8 family peptidase [Bacillus cereus group]|uniref:S8 family peptidase n=1 Tax=Bacillus cereus group TaxID=86661 RepID=UPI000BF8A498|nr:S8 family serine peptidase [Bacillus thuringiensis]MCU4818515.1 S8 family serine peptidase [Bacillus cereus]PEV47236.1 peptidase S8 [Bacillus thuringiensis]HDR7163323.1 S8 family serine peptidase [Bacillus cereus]
MKSKSYFLFLSLISYFLFIPTPSLAEDEHNYSILLKKGTDFNNIKNELQQGGFEITYEIPEINLIQVLGTDLESKNLNHIKGIVKFSESVNTSNPKSKNVSSSFSKQNEVSADLWEYQWDMQSITNNGASYNVFQGSTNVTVGIIDSGIFPYHPDLKNSLLPGSKNLVPKGGLKGRESSETGDINKIDDLLGHGTSVAGQIAANGLMKGVAPGVGIKVYRVFGSTSAETIWVIKAIIEAANDDVDVINLSLGDYLLKSGSYSHTGRNDSVEIEAYKQAINYAYKKGSIVVAAAGNDGIDVNDQAKFHEVVNANLKTSNTTVSGIILDMPGALTNVVTVSSIGPTGELSLFSNHGKDFIDIISPGGDFRLLEQYGEDMWINDHLIEQEQILTTNINGGYYYDSGTSLAAAKVSGALALIVEKNKWKDQPHRAINHLYKYSTVNNPLTPRQKNLDIYKALFPHS